MKKRILFILILVFLAMPNNVFSSSNYNIIVETGLGSRTGYLPRQNSYWRHGNQQGLRVTLVNSSNGNRVSGSVSVDYTELKNIGYYKSFTGSNSKIDYLYNPTVRSRVSLSNLNTGTYAYKSAPVSLPTFVYAGTGVNTISNDVLYKYFENNYLPNTKSVTSRDYVPMNNLIALLIDLKAPNSMINDIKSSRNCIYKENCPTVFSNLKSNYNYSLIIEPIGFFWAKRANVEHYFAATATELGLLFNSASDAGFAGGATHRNIPKSVYMTDDAFGGRLRALNSTLRTAMRNNTWLSSNSMTNSYGVGVGVIEIWDEVLPVPPPPETSSCTPVRTCENGVCDNLLVSNISTYKDSTDWNCIQASKGDATNDMSVSNKGNDKYCPVFCRETVTTSFPKPSQSYVVGTKFSFEPISITSSKECRTDVDLVEWRTDYRDANNYALTTYRNWKTEESLKEGWDNKVRIGACSVDYNYVPDRTFPASAAICLPTTLHEGVRVSYAAQKISDLNEIFLNPPSQFNSGGYTCLMSTSSYNDARSALFLYRWESTIIGSGGSSYTRYRVEDDISRIEFNSYKLPSGVTCTDPVSGISRDAKSLNEAPVRFEAGKQVFYLDADVTPSGSYTCAVYKRTETEVGNRYRYSYYDYNAGRSYTVETCSNVAPATNSSVASRKTIFTNANREITNLESAIRSCSSWDTDYLQDPILKAVQTQTVMGALVTNEYNLESTKSVIKVVPKSTECLVAANCNRNNIVKYSFNTSNGSSNYSFRNVGFVSTGISLFERVEDSATFKFDFNLPSNTNRYLLGSDGVFSNTVPIDYRVGGKFEGAYRNTGNPGFAIDLRADTTKPGTISIKYKNIGENGKFDTCFNVASPTGFSKDVNGFATYTCPYTFTRPDQDDPYDCNDPNKPCPNPSDCLKDSSKCPTPTEDKGINVIYRPIDLNYPFAAFDGKTRQPGFNWNYEIDVDLVDRFITNNRGVKDDAVYNLDPMYVIDFTGSNKFVINEIRNYNKRNNYADAKLTCTGRDSDGNPNFTQCRSTFLRSVLPSNIVTGCGMSGNWTACKGVDR